MLTRDQELLQLAKSHISYPVSYETWGVLELCFSEGLTFDTLADAIYWNELFPKEAERWGLMQLRAYCHVQMLMLEKNPENDWNWYSMAVLLVKTYLPSTIGWKQLFPASAKDWGLAQLMAYCLAQSLILNPESSDAWEALANCFFNKAAIANLPANFVPMIYSCIENDAPANFYCMVFCMEKALIFAQDEDKRQLLQVKYQKTEDILQGFVKKNAVNVVTHTAQSPSQYEPFIPYQPEERPNEVILVKRKLDHGNYSDDSFSPHASLSFLNKMSKLEINTSPGTKTEIEGNSTQLWQKR